MQENITSYPGKTRLMPFTGQDAKEMLGRAEITITRTGQQTWVLLLSFHSLLPMFFLLGYRLNWKSAVLKCCFVFWRLYSPRLFFCYWGIPSTSCLLSTRSSNLRIGRSIISRSGGLTAGELLALRTRKNDTKFFGQSFKCWVYVLCTYLCIIYIYTYIWY